jgi:hypothetical protein
VVKEERELSSIDGGRRWQSYAGKGQNVSIVFIVTVHTPTTIIGDVSLTAAAERGTDWEAATVPDFLHPELNALKFLVSVPETGTKVRHLDRCLVRTFTKNLLFTDYFL